MHIINTWRRWNRSVRINITFLFFLVLTIGVMQVIFIGLSIRYLEKDYQKSEKVILYWNPPPEDEDMGLGLGSDIFENCPVNTCFCTNDKNYKFINQFDAIIFRASTYSTFKHRIPKKRSVHQKYIFFNMESPFNSQIDKKANKNFYNWTMTYREDSDIHMPYGRIRKQPNDYTLPSLFKILFKKHKIAWFVSNCESKESMRRFKFVQELQKHIPVHVYGDCGNYSCDFSNMGYCYTMIERNYKFYLSFEYSFCREYVTDKFFNILKYDVVPVVYGLANYTAIAPPHSFINVMEFKNAKQLAKYLLRLDEKLLEYVRYFEWKSSYVVEDSSEYALCQLCEKLHLPLKHTSYKDVKQWFYGDEDICVP